MATREENLQKINEKLEKLSDDELDNIAGGLSQADDEKVKKLINNPKLQEVISDIMNIFNDSPNKETK